MKLYFFSHDFYNKINAGYYLKEELDIDPDILLNLLQRGICELREEWINCTLINKNGFQKTLRFPDILPTIRIPKKESLEFVGSLREIPQNDYIEFVFKEKKLGKNEFIYYEV